MPTDEAALAERRQANAHQATDIKRQLAVIERRLKALEDRAFVDEILSVTVGETEGETPMEKDTVRA
jgi:hypothetical protein